MPGLTDGEREGALLKRFKAAGARGKTAGFGFVAQSGEDAAAHRSMLVVARVTQSAGLAGEMKALASAGVDGIEIVVRGSASGIKEAIAAVDVPCGVYLAAGDEAPEIEGLDWLHVGVAAPARLLAVKDLTRLVSVPPTLPPGRLGGLGALKAEVLVVDGPGSSDGPADGGLTIETLLSLRTIEAATKQPLLVSAALGVAPDDVAVLHDHGVEGILTVGGVEDVRAFITAIEGL